jgi:hypothetical protein
MTAFVSAYLSLVWRTRSFIRFSIILATRRHRDQRQVLLPAASMFVPEPNRFTIELQGEYRLGFAPPLFVFHRSVFSVDVRARVSLVPSSVS